MELIKEESEDLIRYSAENTHAQPCVPHFRQTKTEKKGYLSIGSLQTIKTPKSTKGPV
jgi:hypothetical protein